MLDADTATLLALGAYVIGLGQGLFFAWLTRRSR